MAVAKHGCGQMGHLTPLNCKTSEHSAREAFNKDRLAVIMEHLFCTAWCACRWRPRGACVENGSENRGEREKGRVIKYQQVVSWLISVVSV